MGKKDISLYHILELLLLAIIEKTFVLYKNVLEFFTVEDLI
jgi:hypothetical protein